MGERASETLFVGVEKLLPSGALSKSRRGKASCENFIYTGAVCTIKVLMCFLYVMVLRVYKFVLIACTLAK